MPWTTTRRLLAVAGIAIVAIVLSGTVARAYVGPSFLLIPGVNGGWQGTPYKNWIKVEAHYWKTANRPPRPPSRAFYSGPIAPRQGASEIMIAIDKRHPALSQLMDRCVKKASIPELTYAGGYQDWRTVNAMITGGGSQAESLYPAPVPGYYHALKRAADGLKDPVTGECNGLSTAYDIEGVSAFIPSDQLDALIAGRSPSSAP